MKKIISIVPLLTLILLITSPGFTKSPASKSNLDYRFTLDVLRNLRISVENFSDEAQKKKFEEIQQLFKEASEDFYGQNYVNSQLKFTKLKRELITFLEEVTDGYLKRTKDILDSTSKDTFAIMLEYSKKSGLAQYFRKAFDPLRDVKPYDPEKYHYFHDRSRMEANLRKGYKKYHRAKKIYNDPDLTYLKKKKNLTSRGVDHIIKSMQNIIFICREAKENGIEIHRIKNVNELGKSLIKYNISHGTITPIFDDRIPEKYKVDANDNRLLIHSVEQKKLEKNQGKK